MALVIICWMIGRMAWNGFPPSSPVQLPARHAQNEQQSRPGPIESRGRMGIGPEWSAVRARELSNAPTGRSVYPNSISAVRTGAQAWPDIDEISAPIGLWPGGLLKDPADASTTYRSNGMAADDRDDARFLPTEHGSTDRSRWTGYSYLYWREGSAQKALAPLPSYGGSQFFARLGYRLSSQSGLEIYGRYASALEASDDKEFAAGVEITPFGAPVHLHFERRIREDRGDANALFVSGGVVRDTLPLSATVSLYGQAGAIFGGPQGTLEFYDGQAELRFPLIAGGGDTASLELGAKLSAGGQGSDNRIDIGPVLKAHIPVGSTQNNLSVGWRERIGGSAEPGSGLAVTASFGF